MIRDSGFLLHVAQRVRNGEMKVRWISTKKQLADCFTKAGAPTTPLRKVFCSGEFDNELYKSGKSVFE